MAVPNPVQELTRLDKLARRGLPPLVVVTGPSDFFRQKAIERLLQAVPEDVELRTVDAGELRAVGGGGGDDDDDEGQSDDAGDGAAAPTCPELQDLRGGGLFARATIVVVRRGANWWTRFAPALVETLPRIQPGSSLILDAPKLDKRKKVAAGLVKQLAAEGVLFELRDLYDLPFDRSRSPLEGELCKWLVGVGKQRGVALQPESAWLMVEQVGKAPAELLAELQRLQDQLGEDPTRPPLAPRDLAGRLTCSFESTPFELASAVLSDDRRAAERSAAAMFTRSVRQKDGRAMDQGGLLPFTTSVLFDRLASLHDARVLLDGGVSLRDLPGKVGVYQFVDQFQDQVRRHDQARLRRGLLALHACQRASRTSGEESSMLLTRFLQQWFDGAPVPGAEEFEL
ncbi:MAG: hypothetical protein H6835_18965 [Planctomycetes bacterium]|nr:hypothetical protein [Planctomycetota bacterium]